MRIQAVIFDWAGTVVDYGCRAPVVVLEQIFASRGVELAAVESRHGMGLLKIDQIRRILSLPRVREAWKKEHGGEAGEKEIRELFEAFVPLQMDCIEEYSDVIAGVPEVVEKLRIAGVKIGSTTGYTRVMLERLMPKAARQGYAPDAVVTPDDVGAGRPYPWMVFENLRQLGVYPPELCVKVGDTESDMQEGKNSGLRRIGVSDSSNDAVILGCEGARRMLMVAGAERVVGTVAELIEILEEL